MGLDWEKEKMLYLCWGVLTWARPSLEVDWMTSKFSTERSRSLKKMRNIKCTFKQDSVKKWWKKRPKLRKIIHQFCCLVEIQQILLKCFYKSHLRLKVRHPYRKNRKRRLPIQWMDPWQLQPFHFRSLWRWELHRNRTHKLPILWMDLQQHRRIHLRNPWPLELRRNQRRMHRIRWKDRNIVRD